MTPDKKITITLVWGVHQYKVTGITNTTYYKPGQWLNVEDVDKLCKLPNWEVSILDDELLKQILLAGIAKIPVPGLPAL